MGILPRSPADTCKEALRDLVAERDKATDRYLVHWQGMEDALGEVYECERLIDGLLKQLSAVRR